MSWWKKILEKILALLTLAFKCKSDCCSCESECSNKRECEHTTETSAEEVDVMEYAKKVE